MNIGAPELIIVLAIILLLFGSTRLPKLARSLGQAQREFKDGIKDPGVESTENPSRDRPVNPNAVG